MKEIQIDLNDKQMVLQTKKYYLCQYFQYRMDYKNAKAEFVSDKCLLKLILPVIRDNDFWNCDIFINMSQSQTIKKNNP